MIGVQSQTNVKDARIAFGGLLTAEHDTGSWTRCSRRIWFDGLETAANAIRRGHDRWKLRCKPDCRFKARFARNVARVRIVELQCRDCRPQNIDRIGFARKLLHQGDELAQVFGKTLLAIALSPDKLGAVREALVPQQERLTSSKVACCARSWML